MRLGLPSVWIASVLLCVGCSTNKPLVSKNSEAQRHLALNYDTAINDELNKSIDHLHNTAENEVLLSGKWLKGQLHAHTNLSDGHNSPEEVISWYQAHQFDFLAITDHNKLLPISDYQSRFPNIILVPGEEVTSHALKPNSPKSLPVHANGLCISAPIAPIEKRPAAETLQLDVDNIRRQDALAQINHPNFIYPYSIDDLLSINGGQLLEVANMNTKKFNPGDATHPSVEKIWDLMLTAGTRIFGTATDDSHDFCEVSKEDLGCSGRGWVQVSLDNETPTPEAICNALSAGRFYGSTGITLSQIQFSNGIYRIKIRPSMNTARHHYKTTWIGDSGKILRVSKGLAPSFKAPKELHYIRAVITGPEGKAWTQPVFIEKR